MSHHHTYIACTTHHIQHMYITYDDVTYVYDDVTCHTHMSHHHTYIACTTHHIQHMYITHMPYTIHHIQHVYHTYAPLLTANAALHNMCMMM